jgi:DNA-binding response OmpR family regulator
MLKSPTILIVDDEPRICESLTTLLKTRDYDVTTANCAQDALALIDEKPFDLAILDVHLPDMMGPTSWTRSR